MLSLSKLLPQYCSFVLNFSDYGSGVGRVLIDLALPCMEPGLRVFEGFTVGFHPRSWEVVRNFSMNFALVVIFVVDQSTYMHKSLTIVGL